MNKAEMIDALTDTLGDKRTATTAVEAVLATVLRTVSTGEKVSVPGFGVFEKVDRAARTARNPATGASVELEATSVPRFRPAQRFKDVVRGAAQVPDLPPPALRPASRTATTSPATPVPAAATAPQPEPAAAAPSRTAPAATAPSRTAPAPGGTAPASQSARAGSQDRAKAGGGGVKKADSRKADKAAPKKADSKKVDSKKVDSKKVDSKKVDSKKASAKQADSKKASAKQADSKKASAKQADSKKAKKK